MPVVVFFLQHNSNMKCVLFSVDFLFPKFTMYYLDTGQAGQATAAGTGHPLPFHHTDQASGL